MRILIAEDDEALADALTRLLHRSGYAVGWVKTGPEADAWLATESCDLLILDLGLPRMDGTEVLRRLRRRNQAVPVLILTARDAIEERVQGLDLGADDYVIKPIALQELEARVRALLRRGQSRSPQLRHGPLVLDTVARRAWLDEQPLELSRREIQLLEYLLSRIGRIVSKEDLVRTLGGWDLDLTPNAVEKLVSRLRAKLETGGVRIRAVRGLGYFLEKPDG